MRIVTGITITLFMTALVITCAVHDKQMHESDQPASRMMVGQIAFKSSSVCRLLEANDGPLQQITLPVSLIDRNGRRHPMVIVDYENDAGQHLMHTMWDAGTGRLVWVAHVAKRGRGGKAKPLVVGSPPRIAWHWMTELGIAGPAESWKLAVPPAMKHAGGEMATWTVTMSSANYRATVLFDHDTGDLIIMACTADKPNQFR